LYTAPKPPSPSLLVSSKSPVAARRVDTSIIIESTVSASSASAEYMGSVQFREIWILQVNFTKRFNLSKL
jgi:hypothetical protein